MKKQQILNLIKYHVEGNDTAFKAEAYQIAKEFENIGDEQISYYVASLLNENIAFVPQEYKDSVKTKFLTLTTQPNSKLVLPKQIADEISGIINALKKGIDINNFLFYGHSGTGKTEAAKQIARILNCKMYQVNFGILVDSKLGETGKNIHLLFEEIEKVCSLQNTIILFDEIDALLLDRASKYDHREIGRATSIFLTELDNLSLNIPIIATTNLYDMLDDAIKRRFDFSVSFDHYSNEDYVEIADILCEHYLDKYSVSGKNKRFLNKLIKATEDEDMPNIESPARLKNIIKTSIAFCDDNVEHDYLVRIASQLLGDKIYDKDFLSSNGFSIRNIALLSGESKSSVARNMGNADE